MSLVHCRGCVGCRAVGGGGRDVPGPRRGLAHWPLRAGRNGTGSRGGRAWKREPTDLVLALQPGAIGRQPAVGGQGGSSRTGSSPPQARRSRLPNTKPAAVLCRQRGEACHTATHSNVRAGPEIRTPIRAELHTGRIVIRVQATRLCCFSGPPEVRIRTLARPWTWSRCAPSSCPLRPRS